MALLAIACGGTSEEGTDDGSASADGSAEADIRIVATNALPPECADASTPPQTLDCTGLYADLATKQIADNVRPYAPATPLWSDGAQKQRWIWLPPGTTIDATDPNEWKFPIGTKLFKEFVRDGRRVETRLWQKVRDKFWVSATYAWNDHETAAVQSGGGDIPWGDGGTYHIPLAAECEKCHRGRTENILGFEQVGLGLPGATGLTLPELVSEGLLLPAPASTSLSIGDDGTGKAAPALAWLHVNCGVTCHNGNSNSTAYGAGMRLRLDPTLLDGRPVTDFDPLKTTLGVAVNAPAWNGQTRIVPGDPAHSLLYSLISHRGPNVQMPPIASNVVDQADIAFVEAWIRAMPLAPVLDANVDVGASPVDAEAGPIVDAGVDSGVLDAGPPDTSVTPDAQVADASVDAGVADVSTSDVASADAGSPVNADASAPDDASVYFDAAAADEPDAGEPADGGSPSEADGDAEVDETEQVVNQDDAEAGPPAEP